MKKNIKTLSKKVKVAIATTTTALIGATVITLGLTFGLMPKSDFETEKGYLWNLIKETPKDTAHAVFINGFVGTSIVTKYLDEISRDNFTVGIIRGYMASGKSKNETQTFSKYSNLEFFEPSSRTTHMKSYFWFNKDKELIRSLTGSGNFSESAIFKVPSYKEVLYDITNYEGVGRDLFCGGVGVSRKRKKENTEIPETMQSLYESNCKEFDFESEETYKSSDKTLIAKKQFAGILKQHKENLEVKKAKGLIVLSGDGDSEVIKDYLQKTNDDNIMLDVFVGNTNAGFSPKTEIDLISRYNNRFNIIREHPKFAKEKDGSYKDDFGLIKNSVPKTHTKIYVWYDENYKILQIWSGSANFSTNGVDFKEENLPFREILIKMKLDRNWKNDLVCKVINAFKTKPSDRISNFCSASS